MRSNKRRDANAFAALQTRGVFITESRPDRDVIHVFGDLDITNAAELESAVTAMVQTGRSVTVNLSKCTYADSGALNALVRIHGWIGNRLHVTALAIGPVRRVLEITGLGEIFEITYETFDESIKNDAMLTL